MEPSNEDPSWEQEREQERKRLKLEEIRFEAWAGPRGYNLGRINGRYNHNQTWSAFDAWSYRALFRCQKCFRCGGIGEINTYDKPDTGGNTAENWPARCPNCDGTGDVHNQQGEWLGECNCQKEGGGK